MPFDIQSYRVILYEHTLKGCSQLKAELEKAIKELLQALDRTNNPFQDIVSRRHSVSDSRKVPITSLCDFSNLPEKFRLWLIEKKIRYSEDFTNELLEELYTTPGIGKSTIAKLCKILMNSQTYPDIEYLHDFVLRNAIDVSGNRLFYS